MKKNVIFHCKGDRRNRSGRVGVSLWTRTRELPNGEVSVRRFYVARVGDGRRVLFSVDALGRTDAFREAVRARERWEREVAAQRALLAPARKAAERERQRVSKRLHGQTNDPAYHAAYYQANRETIRVKAAAYHQRRGKALQQARRAKKK